jgi:hypothetical protein
MDNACHFSVTGHSREFFEYINIKLFIPVPSDNHPAELRLDFGLVFGNLDVNRQRTPASLLCAHTMISYTRTYFVYVQGCPVHSVAVLSEKGRNVRRLPGIATSDV